MKNDIFLLFIYAILDLGTKYGLIERWNYTSLIVVIFDIGILYQKFGSTRVVQV